MKKNRLSLIALTWNGWNIASAGSIILISAITLSAMGRRIWCEGGGFSPWSWDIWSMHNSQHLLDPYSVTHAQHGILA